MEFCLKFSRLTKYAKIHAKDAVLKEFQTELDFEDMV